MTKKNILWIMADQLRWDYLGCYGHPTLKTPVMDSIAERGVRFDRAYVNATICGPSRMCYYTGRHMWTHGSSWNNVPLRVGEMTLGDHLRPLGYRTALVGKTHMTADVQGMQRLGVDQASTEGVLSAECGFEPYVRDDGIHPDKFADPDQEYNRYLASHGYDGPNPWHYGANAGVDDKGQPLSGWYMRNAAQPTVIPDEHSETAFMTNRAMDFIRDAGDKPWCLHLSYIKPHWPYIVQAPYHRMYSARDVIPVNRAQAEREDAHPVMKGYMNYAEGRSFSEDHVRDTVIPIYMGLITQLDDHLGRLMEFLEQMGRLKDTMIVISSDHGDYLGDHWLGEKELFHDESARVPLIVYDPSPQADTTRGTVCTDLVQAIDLAATFVDLAGGTDSEHILEGKSLLPVLYGTGGGHDYVVSELDFSHRHVARDMDLPWNRCRAWMVRSDDWKYVYWEGFRPQLFDMRNDPRELTDLGDDPAHADIRAAHREKLFDWFRDRRLTVTFSEGEILNRRKGGPEQVGVMVGYW
ncbi:sulfatase-like hydrolase/transferase [Paracoccus sp. (in: a-proteobacteria)]|uniref:sulfatase-like hydrolase/transferase n=1 Tax=Paracoccus sp. TaxID=267 RepID=UPI003A84FCC1